MTEQAHEANDRFEVYDAFKKIAQTGDILFRRSDARGAFGLPFMRLVAHATHSDYTHAAICYWDNAVLRICEVSDSGVVEFRFIDWYTLCLGGTFAVYRLRDKPDWVEVALRHNINYMLSEDADYDFTFDDPKKLYCTRAVVDIYRSAGFVLCEPKLIKDIVSPKWYPVLSVCNHWFSELSHGKQKLPLVTPMFFVGNEDNGGMAASPILHKVYEHV